MKCDTETLARGRPREFDAVDALASALRVFWQRGYEGASMAELTRAMGITKPSLYACFGNKEALFRKALDLYEAEKLSYVAKALDAPTARGVAERLLSGAITTHCSESDPKGCMGVINSLACGAEAEPIRKEIIERRASSERAIIERFERALADGDLNAGTDPRALAMYLLTVMQGLSVRASAQPCSESLKSVAATALACWPSR